MNLGLIDLPKVIQATSVVVNEKSGLGPLVIMMTPGSCEQRKGGPHKGVCLDCTEPAYQ